MDNACKQYNMLFILLVLNFCIHQVNNSDKFGSHGPTGILDHVKKNPAICHMMPSSSVFSFSFGPSFLIFF